MRKKVAAITTVAMLSTTLGTSAFASTYQVQNGDTLTKIAQKHNITLPQLKSLNNLKSDMIYINQTLKVSSVVAPTTSKPTTPTTKPKPTATKTATYTVVKGDSLSKIANQHNISIIDLMKWNNLDNYIIFPGQKLKVSSATSTDLDKTVPEKNTSIPQPSVSSEYIVQKGDTLGDISVKVDMSLTELKLLNNLSSDLIFVGQKLLVKGNPVPVKETPVTDKPINNETDTSLINLTRELLGTPYSWGGTTIDGFDCSGFIFYAFSTSGTNISRLSTDGYYSRSYYVDTPQVGDLVFFENTYKPGISHMGIYLGNNEFIHASSSKGVMISSLNEAYYKQRFDGFKRFY